MMPDPVDRMSGVGSGPTDSEGLVVMARAQHGRSTRRDTYVHANVRSAVSDDGCDTEVHTHGAWLPRMGDAEVEVGLGVR